MDTQGLNAALNQLEPKVPIEAEVEYDKGKKLVLSPKRWHLSIYLGTIWKLSNVM